MANDIVYVAHFGAGNGGVVSNFGGTPFILTDIFANRPAAGNKGLFFISTDTQALYEDTGAAWVLMGSGTAVGVTANNGLTASAGNVKLGGSQLTATTLVDLNGNEIGFFTTSNGNGIDIKSGEVDIFMKVGTDTGFVRLNAAAAFGWVNALGTLQSALNFGNASMLVVDTMNSKGLQNNGDYESNFVPRSLATKQYVDAKVPTVTAYLVATNKVTGVTVSGNLITYTVPGGSDFQYRINTSFMLLSGTGTVNVNVTSTNENGVSNANAMGAVTVVGHISNAAPRILNCKSATTIVIDAVITGTAIGNFQSAIEFLQ